MLFPHEIIRPGQQAFMDAVARLASEGKDLVVHAPTGMGKTAAALTPALHVALEKEKTVLFLTGRHTQHEIAVKTLRRLKEKGMSFLAVDVIGKKGMCLQEGIERLPGQEFAEYCRLLKEEGKCAYYEKLKKGEKLTVEGNMVLKHIKERSPLPHQEVKQEAALKGVCPYYAVMEAAKEAQVIIADYFHVFHPRVRELFLARSDLVLDDLIIIVDEAHNLPSRIKDLASARLTTTMLRRASAEAAKHRHADLAETMQELHETLRKEGERLSTGGKNERLLSREEFEQAIARLGDYAELSGKLKAAGDAIREETGLSYLGAIAAFLEDWQGPEEGFVRILSLKRGPKEEVMVSHRCLDPSLVCGPVVREAWSTTLMSGTLTPTGMYRELLGLDDAEELTFPSPFPKDNRLALIIPQTSTKFTTRGEEQWQAISRIVARTLEQIPGNAAVYFPSYYLLDEVSKYLSVATSKTVFTERQEMTPADKQDFLDRFRTYKNSGAVLLGVITGNFGEGIDLPGDELQAVIVVGLPLQRPDLETEALIAYYDRKFKKGWDYGYVLPAFTKTLQSAGRCIRTETDRGVIVFLDERYAWPQYKRCFPTDWDAKVTLNYEKIIGEFFRKE